MIKTSVTCACILTAAVAGTLAHAQTYPTRPVRVIVPFPSGGGVDIVGRTLGDKLGARLGQSVVVDNRPGAGATLGTSLAAKSTPDGHTLLVAPVIGLAIAHAYYRKLDYDLRRDFAPVSKIGFGTVVMVVPPSLGVKSVKEVIALARSKPGQLTFASSGVGGLIHLTGELFNQMTGARILHVPYKGSSQLQPDLIDGRVSMAIDSLPAHLPQIRAGRLRALGVARKNRSAQLPDVPTMTEAGVVGFESYTDYALYAPAGTPATIVDRLHREVQPILELPDVKARLDAIGIEIGGSSPQALQKEIVDEIARWTKVIADANIKPE